MLFSSWQRQMSEYVSHVCDNCQKSKIPTSTFVRNTPKYTSTTLVLASNHATFQDLSSQTMFISVFVFSGRSFSGCVFPDYFLFRRCLFRLHPFQALSCYTISFSTFVFADHILFRNNWKCTFFFQCKPDIIYETADIKRKNIWDILT